MVFRERQVHFFPLRRAEEHKALSADYLEAKIVGAVGVQRGGRPFFTKPDARVYEVAFLVIRWVVLLKLTQQ